MATNNKTMGQSWLRPITKWSNLPIDDVLFQQNKLLNSLLKLGTNLEDMSNSLLEWSKHERNPAYYDVFTNWHKLDSALCSLLYALHYQCNNFRVTFKMIKKKHKIIDTYRKKNEDKKTEIRRIRTKMNTLKRVRLKRKETYVKLQADLNQALEDQQTTTDTLLTEINNFEITKARMVKDSLVAYSQCWTKFTIDSQHVFGAQSQIALEMAGKPDRRTTYTDDNRLIAENALKKLNLVKPENTETDSESFKSSQSDISPGNIILDIPPSRRLPAIPPNQRNSYKQRPEFEHQSSETLDDKENTIYQVTETGEDTDLIKFLENADLKSYRSSTSSASAENEILSDSDYIVPNKPSDSDKESSMKGSQEIVSPEKLESINVAVSTLGDEYLQIVEHDEDNTVYQDIYLPPVHPHEQHCLESSSELGDDIYHDITESDCENQDTALPTYKICDIYEDVSPKKKNLKQGNHSPTEKNNDDADLFVATTCEGESFFSFEEEYVVPDIHVANSDSEFPDDSIYAVCLSEHDLNEKYATESSGNTTSTDLFPKNNVEDDTLTSTEMSSTFDNVPVFYQDPTKSTDSISILPPRVRSKPVTDVLVKRFSRVRDKKVKNKSNSPESNITRIADDLQQPKQKASEVTDCRPTITRKITKPPLMKKPGNKLKDLEKDGSKPSK